MSNVITINKTIKAFAGYAWAVVFFAAILWWLVWNPISKSDLYQQYFEPSKWEIKQERSNEFSRKLDELNSAECAIMVRASAEVLPIEIERNKLFGLGEELSKTMALKEYDLAVKLCNEHGISSLRPAPQTE